MSETAKYNTATILYTVLLAYGTRSAKVNPTLAAGDIQISKDGGAYANLATLPDLTPASLDNVRIQLSATEMQCKVAIIRFKDQTSPREWDEQRVSVTTWGHPSAYDPSKNDVIRSSTAQAGAASSITLDASAVATDRYYNGQHIQILSGTGAGQVRRIMHYVGSSKIAYVNVPWATNPDNTSVYLLTPFSQIIMSIGSGLAQAGAATTITLGSHESATDYLFKGVAVVICGGTGIGQIRTIVSYIGSSKVATVDRAWITNPDSTSLYELISTDAIGNMGILHAGLMQAGSTSTTAVLSSGASATNDYYDAHQVQITAGTGAGQSRIIASYVGSTRTATLTEAWATTPDATSVYIVRPLGDVEVGVNNDKTGYSIATNGISATSIATDAINAASVKADAVTKIQNGLATPTNITAGAITTVTNLTNAPTNGDFTATMKTSLNAATPSVTVSDKTGFSLSTAGIKAVWDQLTSALTATGSIGKKLADWVLGTDSKVLLSTDSQAGVTIPTVTAITNRVTANTDQINGSAPAAVLLALSANTMIAGTVDNTAFTATATEMESDDITDAEANLYKDRWIIFKSGSLNREAKPITSYSLVSGRGHFTYQALSSAPANDETFIIV
jgi:hypothetical protein